MIRHISNNLSIILFTILLCIVISCNNEYPADEGIVKIKIENFKTEKNNWPKVEISPCYDKNIILFNDRLTKEDGYAKTFVLNTGNYRISVWHLSFGILTEDIQIRRGQTVEFIINVKDGTHEIKY